MYFFGARRSHEHGPRARRPRRRASIPVWAWRAIMAQVEPGERRRLNLDPIETVDYHLDLDYVGDGMRDHRLDVIVPHGHRGSADLPVYVYFHGGGWTSGDKAALTKYCASQAIGGMVVVNVNYRKATRLFHMRHMLQDSAAALDWVHTHVAGFGGDPGRIVLGGDSAGGQIASLLASTITHPELAEKYQISPPADSIRGVVQHCSAVDFSSILERRSVLGVDFIRMLLPHRGRGAALPLATRFLSPIEWLAGGFPEVFVTTSEQDYFYEANLRFIERLESHSVPVDSLIYDRSARNARHTWQQDARHPESQEVYRRLHAFVRRVTARVASDAPVVTAH